MGDIATFWEDKWLGSSSLKTTFPALFDLASNKNVSVAEAGTWVYGNWEWNWMWSRQLYEWEEVFWTEAKALLHGLIPKESKNDLWLWKHDQSGAFTVKSAYLHIITCVDGLILNQNLSRSLKALWRTSIPSKVVVFVWRLLLERLPTRDALLRRGIISAYHNICCVFCFANDESVSDVFFSCPFAYNIW